MKVCRILGLLCATLMVLTACSMFHPLPDTVTISGEEYVLSEVTGLYPADDATYGNEITVDGEQYMRVENSSFSCYVAYENNGEPRLYFTERDTTAAEEYYTAAEHFEYILLYGSIFEAQGRVIRHLSQDVAEPFEELLAFATAHEYTPFSSGEPSEDMVTVPYDSDDGGEIHFYKTSEDGAFTTMKGHTFYMLDTGMVYVYTCDTQVGEMTVVELPDVLNTYFIDLCNDSI